MGADALKEQILNMYVDHYLYSRENIDPELMDSILKDLEDAEILLVEDGQEEAYSGEGFVLLRKNGKLYENNSSHCSCHSHEGQWGLEETTKEALLKRDFFEDEEKRIFGVAFSKEQLTRMKQVIEGLE